MILRMMPLCSWLTQANAFATKSSASEPEQLAVAPAPEQPAAAQTEGQAELEAVPSAQEEPSISGSGRLAEISEGELEVLIEQRAAAERKAAQQAVAQLQEQMQQQGSEQEPQQQESAAASPPLLDLSRLSEEDLQRELSKRQLASKIVSDVADAK